MLTHLPLRNFVKDDIIMELQPLTRMSLAVKYAPGPKPDACWFPFSPLRRCASRKNQLMIPLFQSPCRRKPARCCLERPPGSWQLKVSTDSMMGDHTQAPPNRGKLQWLSMTGLLICCSPQNSCETSALALSVSTFTLGVCGTEARVPRNASAIANHALPRGRHRSRSTVVLESFFISSPHKILRKQALT
jgi:hypothetical protein